MTDNTFLVQLNDLQNRVSKQDAVISSLKSQLERGYSNVAPMRMSVPLNDGRRPRGPRLNDNHDRRGQRVSTPHPTLTLSDVITKNENVTIQIKTGVDSNGVQSFTTALTTFDGTCLEVVECALVNSLVGMKSSKPGEILYRFMEKLKEGGHIKTTFGIAPWRLCFVVRNGVSVSLEELRSKVS